MCYYFNLDNVDHIFKAQPPLLTQYSLCSVEICVLINYAHRSRRRQVYSTLRKKWVYKLFDLWKLSAGSNKFSMFSAFISSKLWNKSNKATYLKPWKVSEQLDSNSSTCLWDLRGGRIGMHRFIFSSSRIADELAGAGSWFLSSIYLYCLFFITPQVCLLSGNGELLFSQDKWWLWFVVALFVPSFSWFSLWIFWFG